MQMKLDSRSVEESVLKCDGPTSLKKIEERLLEIEHEKPMRMHNLGENFSAFAHEMEGEIEADEIAYLDVEKTKLRLKREFILDSRSSWKAKTIWDVAVPIAVSIVTTYLVSVFIAK